MNTNTPFKVNLAVFADTKAEQLSCTDAFSSGFFRTEREQLAKRRFLPWGLASIRKTDVQQWHDFASAS